MKFLKKLNHLSQKLKKFISPRQADEEKRRKELILNILIIFSSFGFFILNLIRISDYIRYPEKRGLPLSATLLMLLFFIFLFWLNRRGWLKVAASLFVIIFAIPMFYSFFIWGADLPAGILLAVLVIVLSGILLAARVAFLSTAFISLFLVVITDHQAKGLMDVQTYWRDEPAQIGDAIAYAILLLIIASIAWLFCKEINRSLKRAKESERLLREERDLLEIKVQKRTQELREAEAEKINQLYRFAEFGRLSSGIFHDLMNPLTAVSLNLEQIKAETDTKILDAKSYLNQALIATGRMENLIASIKKQITQEETVSLFSVNKEIEQIIQILSYKARRAQVNLIFPEVNNVELKGDSVKFGQIIINLLANAIEACEDSKIKEISVNISNYAERIEITIRDSGIGIPEENLEKIFNPFFSTKSRYGRGLGIGLASTKGIIEKNFKGTIRVESEVAKGTNFIINLPKKNE